MYGKRSFQTHDKVYEELTSQNPIHLGWVGMLNTPATPFLPASVPERKNRGHRTGEFVEGVGFYNVVVDIVFERGGPVFRFIG